MNRIIKFRGLYKGNWRYVTSEDGDWEQFWLIVDKNTIGQFVGLHDKNSREIYDGDIVKGNNPWDNHGDTLNVVRYENGTWNYSYILLEYAEDPSKAWEVVGNIHDSPELLPLEQYQQITGNAMKPLAFYAQERAKREANHDA